MQRDYAFGGTAAHPAAAVAATADAVLINRIALGDRRAMQVLFARHNVRVYRFLARIVGDRSAAEDLVSDVFLDVWRKAGQFEGRSQVSTWLLAIAHYKALTHLRQRTMDYLDDDTAKGLEDPADDPSEHVAKKDLGTQLRRCLTQLSLAHREVIDLVYYHEKSTDEVARILDVPEATVRTRMFYARKRLASLLKANGIEHASA